MVNGVADRPPRVDRRVMRTRKLIGDSLTSLLAGKTSPGGRPLAVAKTSNVASRPAYRRPSTRTQAFRSLDAQASSSCQSTNFQL